jgi:hypothetical protein
MLWKKLDREIGIFLSIRPIISIALAQKIGWMLKKRIRFLPVLFVHNRIHFVKFGQLVQKWHFIKKGYKIDSR